MTMRELLDTLKTATQEERAEFLSYVMTPPLPGVCSYDTLGGVVGCEECCSEHGGEAIITFGP